MTQVETNGPTIIWATWFLFAFCSCFLAVRLYAKISRGQGLWWDDWILIVSWVSRDPQAGRTSPRMHLLTDMRQACLAVESILTQTGYMLGFGMHYKDINPEHLSTIALYTSIGASISCFASTGSKISFGVTLLRLTFGWWRRFVWFAIITLFFTMLPSAIFTWIECTPSEKAWNASVEGYCWPSYITVNYGIFNAAWCTVMDFSLALIPWHLIAGLQMKTREKIGVSVAMSMGIL